jgi:hypothetical protein
MGSREAWQHLLEMSYLDATYPSAEQSGAAQSSPEQSLDDSFMSASSGACSVSSLLIDLSDESGNVPFSRQNLVNLSFVEPDKLFSSVPVTVPAPNSVRSESVERDVAKSVSRDKDYRTGHPRNYKLSDYWSKSPVLWFEQAESAFSYYGEHLSRDRYHRVVGALPEFVLKTVSDIVADPPISGAYECLKDRLLASVKVSDYQKADRLMSMPALGDRRPSDMMAAMLDMCPRGWSQENLFAHLFLSRLPQHLRVLLRTRDTADLRALAEAADELHDLHLPSTGSQVNACLISSQDGPVVAAVAGGPSKAAKKPAGWLPLEQYRLQQQEG